MGIELDPWIPLRVAMIRYPEVGMDPFRLAALSGLAPNLVQRLLLELPSEEEVERWKAEKLEEATRMNTPDPVWHQRSILEEAFSQPVE